MQSFIKLHVYWLLDPAISGHQCYWFYWLLLYVFVFPEWWATDGMTRWRGRQLCASSWLIWEPVVVTHLHYYGPLWRVSFSWQVGGLSWHWQVSAAAGCFCCVVFGGLVQLATGRSINQLPKTTIILMQISLIRLIDALKSCAGIAQ